MWPWIHLQHHMCSAHMYVPVILALGRWKQGAQKFKVIFSYINWSPAWPQEIKGAPSLKIETQDWNPEPGSEAHEFNLYVNLPAQTSQSPRLCS